MNMIERFCVVFRVLFAFDVKLRNLNYSLFKAYSLTISTNTTFFLIQFGDKIPAVITFSPNRVNRSRESLMANVRVMVDRSAHQLEEYNMDAPMTSVCVFAYTYIQLR